MAIVLKPIKAKRISDQVFDQLRDLILRGQLKPGEQLMTERELAATMDVSRTSVREAINKLVAMGLLEQKQGQGTFARSPETRERNPLAAAMETQGASLQGLLEVRLGLECNAASMAAQRAAESDIHFMKESLEEMRIEVASGRLGTEADVSFHMAIAYATKNPVQVYIMRNFYDFLFYGIKENLRHLYEDSERIDAILSQHTAIFTAIRDHDPQRAFNAMRSHIGFVLDFVHASIENAKG
jgi:GntR family transcriptional repressor for pyruvate dehydrogenase complex